MVSFTNPILKNGAILLKGRCSILRQLTGFNMMAGLLRHKNLVIFPVGPQLESQ